MKTNSSILSVIVLTILLIAGCIISHNNRIITSCCMDCTKYSNKDSLINCILTTYNLEAYDALFYCHQDSNIILYSILVADSSIQTDLYDMVNMVNHYDYGINDTTKLFYTFKAVVMGCYSSYEELEGCTFPDSIYDIFKPVFMRFVVLAKDVNKYAKEYENIDSLYNAVLIDLDIDSYNKLRLLVSRNSLLPVSITIANKTHYPIACFDVYYNTIKMDRVSDDKFQFAYKYLCEAADSMYYPAIFLKAGLCLTGAYFPPDTILGKKLLEQCHGKTSIPFWQQYYKPVVYQHLLDEKKFNK